MTESIVKTSRSCFFCGRETGLERHHIMFGTANRRLSEEDGLVVYLCHYHHRLIHDSSKGREFDIALKQAAELAWLKHYGGNIRDFVERYGKNFLYEDWEG